MKVAVKIVVFAVVVLALGFGFVKLRTYAGEVSPEFLQGQMEARRVMVAGKLAGRVEQMLVREGDEVKAGDLVAVISSEEIEAKKLQAKGALKAAKAQASKAKAGARTEEVEAARAMAERANDAAELAKATYERVQKLFEEGVTPRQKRDEAETQMKTSLSAAKAAKAQYDQALAGARSEDKAAAEALVLQAKGADKEVDAYLENAKIVSPIAGEVTLKMAEEGEIVGAGSPVAAVTDLKDAWAVFNIREDLLASIRKGSSFKLLVPALGNLEVQMEVYYISSAGDFAVWKSSRESGGFDLKTFEVRLRPSAPVEGLRPGMTVLFPLAQVGQAL